MGNLRYFGMLTQLGDFFIYRIEKIRWLVVARIIEPNITRNMGIVLIIEEVVIGGNLMIFWKKRLGIGFEFKLREKENGSQGNYHKRSGDDFLFLENECGESLQRRWRTMI